MRRMKCGACGDGILRTVITYRNEDGTKYRKKVCESCEVIIYTKEATVSHSEYCEAWAEYCGKSRKLKWVKSFTA